MAKADDRVMGLVEDELKKNPDITTVALFEKAKAASPPMNKLTLRQFNARYPLQVKRRAGGGGRRKKRAAKAAKATKGRRAGSAVAGNGRDQVRDTFLRFATAMAAAEGRGDLVKVLASVDRYVDDVMKAAAR